MSPSVIIPTIMLLSITAVTPSLFSLISTITSEILLVLFTLGDSLLAIKSETRKYNLFPNAPPG